MNRAQLFLHEYSMFRRSWIRRGDHYWRSCCKIYFKNFCHQKIQKHWSPPYLISAPLCQTYEPVLGPSKCDQYVAMSVHDYSFEKYPGHNMILNIFFFFFFLSQLRFLPFPKSFQCFYFRHLAHKIYYLHIWDLDLNLWGVECKFYWDVHNYWSLVLCSRVGISIFIGLCICICVWELRLGLGLGLGANATIIIILKHFVI